MWQSKIKKNSLGIIKALSSKFLARKNYPSQFFSRCHLCDSTAFLYCLIMSLAKWSYAWLFASQADSDCYHHHRLLRQMAADNQIQYTKCTQTYTDKKWEMHLLFFACVVWSEELPCSCDSMLYIMMFSQTALNFRQKMLREDWEFFRSQRRLLEQQLSEQKTANHGYIHINVV